ncbi:uncharacterized protein ALTATR162_LOCUS3537 [Alternaria atra]|uniref:NmrA-like domain-containing protein n=1 Tax=Alternaria atra TaxID=119953 RepID=A0A8J2MYF4_9PLEO|nr:uncharacterized protein ALTATR162_LOCUS3537 [Alternaria atra]CAG5154262.1 unnamed protein product [Alternaria atra]
MSGLQKTVVVVGATGKQGSSVVQEFLQKPLEYRVRGLTRDPNSSKAKALSEQGVEVVQADANDFASLSNAFQGAHVIYAMTDFWQAMSFDVEYEQGKAMADIAAGLPQLEHLVWAGLPDGRAISEGRYTHIYHWQSKAAVTDYIRESKPDLWARTTVILFPNYFENCTTNPRSYLPVKQSDGVYVRSFPLPADTPLPNVSIADTGKLVYQVVTHNTEYYKRTIAFYSQAISEGAKLEVLSKHHGIPVRYEQISELQFRTALEAHMPPITALDFTEQLMLFDGCGMIYDRPEFVQANQIEGLELKTWETYVKGEDLLSHMESA